MNNKFIKYKTKYIFLTGGNNETQQLNNDMLSKEDNANLKPIMKEIDDIVLTKTNDRFKCSLIDIKSVNPKTTKQKIFLTGLAQIYEENINNYEKSIEYTNYQFNKININNDFMETLSKNKINTLNDYIGVLERNYIPLIYKIGNTIINVLDKLLIFTKTNQITYYDIPSYLSNIQKQQNIKQENEIIFADSNVKCDFKIAIENSYHQPLAKYFPLLKEQFVKLKEIISKKTTQYNNIFDIWINDILQFIIKYNTSVDKLILYKEELVKKITPEYNKCNRINIDDQVKKICNKLDKQEIKNCTDGYKSHKQSIMDKSEEISTECITNKFLNDSETGKYIIDNLPETNDFLSNLELKCINEKQNRIPGKYKYNSLRNKTVDECKQNILKEKFPPIKEKFKDQLYTKL
jgi:hypothetical protein